MLKKSLLELITFEIIILKLIFSIIFESKAKCNTSDGFILSKLIKGLPSVNSL